MCREPVTDAGVVHPASADGADARRHNRHPPPAVRGREDFTAPPGHGREEPWPEVARRVDGVSRVPAEGSRQLHDQQADDDRRRGRLGAGELRVSVMPRMTPISSAVPSASFDEAEAAIVVNGCG